MNSINPFANYLSGAQSKEIKNSFMPKIKREPKSAKFGKLSKYLTQNLFHYFNYKELYELGKTDLFFMNNVIEYLENNETWPEQIRKLKSKYNFKIYQNEVDLTLKEAKMNKRRYKFPEENNHINYYQFDVDGNRYIFIASSYTWAWANTNNNNYWTKEEVKGSYEKNGEVYRLINVCWLDTTFYFYHVNPNNNYKLYINEFFLSNRQFENRLKLTIELGENKKIYEKDFPSSEIYNKNKGSRDNAELKEDYIYYIKKEDFNDVEKDQNGDCLVGVKFLHKDLFWKSGWYIDGGSLVEISDEEIKKEIEKEKEKEDEKEMQEEKKSYSRIFYREDEK